MIKRELAKDPTLKNENWDRFLPTFKKKNIKTQKPKQKKEKKEEPLYPPAPQPRKEDIEIETGEFFLKEEARKRKQMEEKKKKQEEKVATKKKEKEKLYKAPKEEKPSFVDTNQNQERTTEELKNKILENQVSVILIIEVLDINFITMMLLCMYYKSTSVLGLKIFQLSYL